MARFQCAACGGCGDLVRLSETKCCPDCGSADLRLLETMDDYPKGHPFWNELAGAADHGDGVDPKERP
jgi:hypothetical protein